VLLPALPLEAGKSLPVSMFVEGQARVVAVTLKVGAAEKVTVPAGEFDAYRVEMTGGPQPLTLWVTTATPRRVVKVEPTGQPVVIELVK
jgi:hypothetical protein